MQSDTVCVYAISNAGGRLYIGMSECPERRLKEHNSGKTKSTKGFRPWRLVCTRECRNRQEAREVEKQWKSGCGKERIRELYSCPCSSEGYLPAGRQGAPVS
jgi:putative endonuclease